MLHTNQRGPAFWKLSTSFPLETDYVNLIKTTIKMAKDDFKGDNTVSPALLCRTSYAAHKNKISKRSETEIERWIASLEKDLDSSSKAELRKSADLQLNGLKSELKKKLNPARKVLS